MSKRVPWLRILVEGGVIVASILLAFFIDATWEERQERTATAALADLLRSDVQSDLANLRAQHARGDTIVTRLTELLTIHERGVEQTSPDSLATLVVAAFQANTFEPSLGALAVSNASPSWDRLPPGIQIELSEFVRGPGAYNQGVDAAAIEALVSLAGSYGGLTALFNESAVLPFERRSINAEGVADFVRDPQVASWMLIHWAMVQQAGGWMDEWVTRLAEVERQLAELAEGGA